LDLIQNIQKYQNICNTTVNVALVFIVMGKDYNIIF
jgi:hypothetical protein